MSQDVQTRLHTLEQSARRWKVLALSSWAVLALLLVLCLGLGVHQARARQIAVEAEQQARQEAEKQRLEQEKVRKKAEKMSMMHLYRAHILLAQQAWERQDPRLPAGKP